MLGLAIEVRGTCSGCGQPLPLNACAEHVVCASCQRTTDVPADRWKSLLEDSLANITELEPNEGINRTIMTAAGTFQLMFGRQSPRCATCKTDLPDEAVGFLDRGWTVCVGCGARMTLRRPPEALVHLGVFALVGEDESQLAGARGPALPVPNAPTPVVLFCPTCKAPLTVDGSNRMVGCQYCSTNVYLPDDLWQRLHPIATVSRWYAWLPDIDIAARARATFKWSTLGDIVIDSERTFYCVGDGDDRDFVVWSMGPDLAVRWIRTGLDFDGDRACIAVDRGGRLLLWERGKHSLMLLSAADGSTLGKLGGREADGAREHALDLDDCDQLLADVDGTILAFIAKRLVRYEGDGRAVATWPPRAGLFGPKPEKLRPLYRAGHILDSVEDAPYVESLGHQPTLLDDYTKLCVGHDGRLYAERSEKIACFDREGKRVYRTKLPLDRVCAEGVAADGAGRCYVLGATSGNPDVRKLLRVSADGDDVQVIAVDRRHGGVLGDEDRLVVAADGTAFVFGYGRRVRIIAPDGRLVHISDESRDDEVKEDEREARRA